MRVIAFASGSLVLHYKLIFLSTGFLYIEFICSGWLVRMHMKVLSNREKNIRSSR